MSGGSYLGGGGRTARNAGHAPRERGELGAPRGAVSGGRRGVGGGGADPASGGSATAAPRSKADGAAGVTGRRPGSQCEAARGGADRPPPALPPARCPRYAYARPPPRRTAKTSVSVWRGGGCQKTFGGEAGGGEGGGGEVRGERGAERPQAPKPPALREAGRAQNPPRLRVR